MCRNYFFSMMSPQKCSLYKSTYFFSARFNTQKQFSSITTVVQHSAQLFNNREAYRVSGNIMCPIFLPCRVFPFMCYVFKGTPQRFGSIVLAQLLSFKASSIRQFILKWCPTSNHSSTGVNITAANQNTISSKASNTGFGTRMYAVYNRVLLELDFHFAVRHSTFQSRHY